MLSLFGFRSKEVCLYWFWGRGTHGKNNINNSVLKNERKSVHVYANLYRTWRLIVAKSKCLSANVTQYGIFFCFRFFFVVQYVRGDFMWISNINSVGILLVYFQFRPTCDMEKSWSCVYTISQCFKGIFRAHIQAM